MTKAKILFWDIETSYSIMVGFSLWDAPMSYKKILKEWNIISASWKWKGENKVHHIIANKDDDRNVVEKLVEVLSQADIVVHHNGDKFDLKKLRGRMLFHGMSPLTPVTTVDTLTLSRRMFGLMSHKLGYLADYLQLSARKGEPSEGLWMKVLKGDNKAVKEMVKYCDQDVRVLEQVYDKLSPYMTNHPSIAIIENREDRGTCHNCGSSGLHRAGYRTMKTKKVVRYKCNDCGAWKQISLKEEDKILELK